MMNGRKCIMCTRDSNNKTSLLSPSHVHQNSCKCTRLINQTGPTTRAWNRLENFLQFRLLIWSQTRRELDFDLHNKVTTFVGLPGLRHSLSRESFFISWLGWSGTRNGKLSTVDGSDSTAPARQSFFEAEFNCRNQIVSDTLKVRMFFLLQKFSHAV